MKFNTAIFYDIENLLKGYSFSDHMLATLSLADIFEAIRKTNKLGQVAAQRAYANWSDPRLRAMRGEINELGIDPIQVFGFANEQKKNAADIQLAIDAIDLAHVRPALEVFVIVSGDGGFAALAKKLHEYGKTVIGCAYRQAANRTFKAVCDDFVWIADPDAEERSIQAASQPGNGKMTSNGLDPRNVRLVSQIKPIAVNKPRETLAKSKEVLTWYATDRESRVILTRNGIHLSTIQQALTHAIPDFQPIQLGFTKFSECLQYLCVDTELCIVRLPPSEVLLASRHSPPPNAEIMPDLPAKEIHTVDTYQAILSKGAPVIRLPTPAAFHAITAWLVEHPIQLCDLGTAIEEIVIGLNDAVTAEAAKLAISSLAAANLLIREPANAPLAEQTLSLRHEIESVAVAMERVKTAVIEKLTTVLPTVEEKVVRQLLPEVT
ncbi:MAG: NYN domain-containing protein [Caldilineaceae bacterium]